MAPRDHREVVCVGDEGARGHDDEAEEKVGLGEPVHDPRGPITPLVFEQAARAQWRYKGCQGQGNHAVGNLKKVRSYILIAVC